MKTQLSNAYLHASIACSSIQDAHSAAIKAEDQFAEIVLIDLLDEAHALRKRIARALDAVNAADGGEVQP